jgi:hypothetical protein
LAAFLAFWNVHKRTAALFDHDWGDNPGEPHDVEHIHVETFVPQLIGQFEQWSIEIWVKPDGLDCLGHSTTVAHVAHHRINASEFTHGVVDHCLQVSNVKN